MFGIWKRGGFAWVSVCRNQPEYFNQYSYSILGCLALWSPIWFQDDVFPDRCAAYLFCYMHSEKGAWFLGLHGWILGEGRNVGACMAFELMQEHMVLCVGALLTLFFVSLSSPFPLLWNCCHRCQSRSRWVFARTAVVGICLLLNCAWCDSDWPPFQGLENILACCIFTDFWFRRRNALK